MVSVSDYTRREREAARLILAAQEEARENARLAALIIMQAPAEVIHLAMTSDDDTARKIWRMYLERFTKKSRHIDK